MEGILGGVDLDKFFPQPDSGSGSINPSGHTKEKRKISDSLGENGRDPSQCETYMGIPFEAESKLKPVLSRKIG